MLPCSCIGAVLTVSLAALCYVVITPFGPPHDAALTKPYRNISEYTKTPWFFEEHPSYNLSGKIALVTGGSSGIGKAIARGLYKSGATVVLTSRRLDRAAVAVAALEREDDTSIGTLEPMALDLSDLSSVRKFVDAFTSRHSHLHFLVENAGAVFFGDSSSPGVGKDGFEMTYVGNYLGHFMLLNLLMPTIQNSVPARIVAVSSIAHWVADADHKNLLPAAQQKSLEGHALLSAYANSKLAQIMMCFELQRRMAEANIRGVTIAPSIPGAVATAIMSNDRGVDMAANPILVTPDQGAQSSLHILMSPSFEGKTGVVVQPYYSPLHQQSTVFGNFDMPLVFEVALQKFTRGMYEWLPSPSAHHRAFAKELWDASAEACGITTI